MDASYDESAGKIRTQDRLQFENGVQHILSENFGGKVRIFSSKIYNSYFMTLGFVAIAAVLSEILYRYFDVTHLSMLFSAAILSSALIYGQYQSYLATICAFFIFHFYYLEPRFSIKFERVDDFTVLAGFIIVSMLSGNLSRRIRKESDRNEELAENTSRLFGASQKFSRVDSEEEIREILSESIAITSGGSAICVDRIQVWQFPNSFEVDHHLLALAAESLARATVAGHFQVPDSGWQGRMLKPGDASLGFVIWRVARESQVSSEDQQVIDVMIDLGATAIARARLSRERAEIETLARTQRLRDALLSSISHDLRTPLTAILASASSLREFGAQFSQATRTDLLVTIEEEAQRLNRFVANLLSMTRLESGMLSLDRHPFNGSEVINRVVDRLRRTGCKVDHPSNTDALIVLGDPLLLEQALENVADNAARYSKGVGGISIKTRIEDDGVVIEVADEGSGLPASEYERIFDKFYRADSAGDVQGTGLGLSIARGLVMAMDGSVRAKSRSDGRRGLVIEFVLRHGGEALA
ncbi:MAG: hypothetical protein CGW95_00355 [Phenylobacterium zucineum]|nr:MAG: hypothetical protein CGW95_00355 [Phenylobacterium zucineum]